MSYLLRKMEMEISPVKGGQMSEQENAFYQQAKEEFLERLGDCGKGAAFILAVHQLMDELTAEYLEEHEIACYTGCYWCCLQLVVCNILEMHAIVRWIKFLPKPRRRLIKQKAKKEALNFNRFFHTHQSELQGKSGSLTASLGLGVTRWEDIGLALREAHQRKPCVFLIKNQCSVYPVRPVECRSARTKDNTCGKRTKEGVEEPKQIRLLFDQVASQLVTDEGQRIHGHIQATPLIGWPVMNPFAEFFLGRKV